MLSSPQASGIVGSASGEDVNWSRISVSDRTTGLALANEEDMRSLAISKMRSIVEERLAAMADR